MLTAAFERGDAREWKANPKGGSWAQLAKQLNPPQKPELGSLAKMTGSLGDSGASYFIGFAIFVVTIYLFYQYGFEIGNIYVPLVCVVWILIVLGIWRLLVSLQNARLNLMPKLSTWSDHMSKWNALYYCVRDNRVFAPSSTRSVAPEQMRELILPAR
jgi:hypothetical protein